MRSERPRGLHASDITDSPPAPSIQPAHARQVLGGKLAASLAEMLRWHGRLVTAAAALLVLALARFLASGTPELKLVVSLVMLGTLLGGVVLALVTVGWAYVAGREAFGATAALGYVVVALLLLGVGALIVPHMLRLDVKRLRDVDVDGLGGDPANPFRL